MTISRGGMFAIFAASGFAGLIYESIWSHYLRLFLGHAAYAQTLVLAIMMGGMAFGAWACSRFSRGWRNLLRGYAIAEALIGVLALVFHPVFVAVTDFAYDTVIPALGSTVAVSVFKVTLSAILILPQSVLLGATFPLVCAGIIRAFPDRSGGTIATLYFTNSMGAAFGVLASGFYLIGKVGLPGAVLTAGIVNIALALLVWLLARDQPPAEKKTAVPGEAGITGFRFMLAVAFFTGAASFMYEIGWIRMLSMVLGGSTHAFELMLSAFIFGLAFGGLWMARRIDAIAYPERFLGVVQVLMGVLALATLVAYGSTFSLMQVLMDTVARSAHGYAAFNTGSHLIALLVMFPAAFCAGMTLPLITHVLLVRSSGERAIGAVYAANTVGAIAGVALATHLAMPSLGLKGLLVLGAGIDIALGIALFWHFSARGRVPILATAFGVASVAGVIFLVELDSMKMASGVYRMGKLMAPGAAEILFHRDGKTATVNLVRSGDRLSITTNGKSDAMMSLAGGAEAGDDEPVMVMLGALPVLLYPQARTAAVIGFGSGITSHVLLASDTLRELDTIEIEPAMIEAARGFRPRNAAVFDDPRSRIHIDDAKTFFSATGKRYDLIISEPSNPWVSGVASLFSDEFYRRVRRHLERDGLFVQWLQLYEIEPALVASVMGALARNFAHYEIYAPDDGNLVIVAREGVPVPSASEAAFRQSRLAVELARLRIRNAVDADLFRVGPRQALQPYFERFAIAPNSDYFPILDQNAARARFMRAQAEEVIEFASLPIPAIEFLGGAGRRVGPVPPRPWFKRSESARIAQQQAAFLLTGEARHLDQLPVASRREIQLARLLLLECSAAPGTDSLSSLFSVAGALLPHLAMGESRPVWQKLGASRCQKSASRVRWLALFEAIDGRDAKAMARAAELLLTEKNLEPHSNAGYLLLALTLGTLASGDRERAALLWHQYGRLAESDSRNPLRDFVRDHLAVTSGIRQ